MTPDQLTECMHAVLDGTATAEQSMLLQAVLASDARAAEEFDSWKSMFGSISTMAMTEPPEGLIAKVEARIDARIDTQIDGQRMAQKLFASTNQLNSSAPVIGSRQTTTTRMPSGFKAFFRRSNRPESSSQEFDRMNVNRKYLAGGAIAAVVLGVAIVVGGYPPKAENVLGTVVPAERYRAPQAGAEAVKLGDPTTTTPTPIASTTTGEAANADAELKARQSDADMKARDSDAAMKARDSDAAMKARDSDAGMKARDTDAGMKARQSDADMKARQSDADMKARESDAGMKARQSDADMKARQSDADMKVRQSDAELKARQSDAAMKARQSDAELKARQSDAEMKARNADASMKAQKTAE